MRELDIALATLALRASPAKPQAAERRLVPAVDDADAAMLDRGAVEQQRAALIVSLWPAPTRECVAPPLYLELPAPAMFGMVFRVTWLAAPAGDARALQERLGDVFAASRPEAGDSAALAA